MRLKYYLRGVGIGIIFATLVMTVSSLVHKYNISDEYIIREARKLGMVMKDEQKNDGLWAGEDTEENSTDESGNTQNSQATEDSQSTEDTQVAGSETVPSESESESTAPVEPEPPAEPEPPVEPEPPAESETVEYVTVVIESGDYARQVAEKVRDAGLIQDAEDFRKYIGTMGYGQSMHPGTYYIPVGSDYEEICQILLVRQR